jgi:rhamnosyl/mannosyltransferase
MKLKILHFHKGNYFKKYGGIERMVYELATSLKNDCENTVISVSDFEYENSIVNGVNFINFKKDFSFLGNPFSFKALVIFYKEQKNHDIINLHYPDLNNDFLSLLTTKPIVLTYHSDIIGHSYLFNIYKFFRAIFFSTVSKMVFTSQNYLKSTRQISDKIKSKCSVIPIGISLLEKKSIEKNYSCDFFLVICQMRKYKGLDILFKLDTRNFNIIVIGGGDNLSKYREKAKKLKKNIEFLGDLPEREKNYYLKNCIAVISTSNKRSEAFGVSLVEGLMFAKPIVSRSNNTGSSMINTHGINGFEYKDDDHNLLQEFVNTLFGDVALRKKMGLRSFNKYNKSFTSKKMAESYLQLYKDIVEH